MFYSCREAVDTRMRLLCQADIIFEILKFLSTQLSKWSFKKGRQGHESKMHVKGILDVPERDELQFISNCIDVCFRKYLE